VAALGGTAVRNDPLLGFNFLVSLVDVTSTSDILKSAALSLVGDVLLGGFSECSGLEMSLAVHDHEEGGNNGATLRFPGRVTWSNIILKRGLTPNTELWNWHYGFVTGTGKRRNGVITLMDSLHVPSAIWYFQNGLPVKYTGPTMDAAAKAVAMESVTIAHEGVYQLPGVGAAASLVSGALSGDLGGAVGGGVAGAVGLF